jgi:hypothetical protein
VEIDDPPPRAASASMGEEEDHGEPRGGVPLRPVLIVAALLILALAAYGGYACVQSTSGGSTFSDSVAHYAPGSVTYLASARTYLVRQADGSFLALSDAEANEADRIAGCLIRYRPDLRAAGETGVFWDDCHGVLFNRMGAAVQGSSAPMQRHPVSASGGRVTVRITSCVDAANQPQACRA